MVHRGRAVGHTFSQPGLFIAATAAVGGLSVVTRNVADFALAGVPVFIRGPASSRSEIAQAAGLIAIKERGASVLLAQP